MSEMTVWADEAGLFRRLRIYLLALTLGIAIATSCLQAQQDTGQPHLYFFTNAGCPPCRMVEPEIQKLAAKGYQVTKVDIHAFPKWADHFSIQATPTVVLVVNKNVVERAPGIVRAEQLEGWFAKHSLARNANQSSSPNFAQGSGTRDSFSNMVSDAKSESRIDADPAAPSVGGNQNWQSAAVGGRTQIRPITTTDSSSSSDRDSTLHQGTRVPGDEYEKLAMRASVRLKVEDPEGISYATGTVVHSHDGESLVLTCGHVFRDAGGKGDITADFVDGNGQQQTASGQLIFYDAKARDVGLVSIKTGTHVIKPVEIAQRLMPVRPGAAMFSVGCDHGRAPTIRRTTIKRTARYDGMLKYDIVGRPVDGRSGGGLFTPDGKLIGVCNAATVDFDLGIYSSLDTIYWQIEKVNLAHLFPAGDRFASNQSVGQQIAGVGSGAKPQLANDSGSNPWDEKMTNPALRDSATLKSNLVDANSGLANSGLGSRADSGWEHPRSLGMERPIAAGSNRSSGSDGLTGRFQGSDAAQAQVRQHLADQRTDVSWARSPVSGFGAGMDKDAEVIIIVRSRTNPNSAETITVSDPSPRLLEYLKKMRSEVSGTRDVNVASLRASDDLVPIRR